MAETRQSSTTIAGSGLEGVVCPLCAAAIELRLEAIECTGCQRRYPRLGSIPVLVTDPQAYLALVRHQLQALREQVDQTAHLVQQQLAAADVLPSTRSRCAALLAAARAQHADIAELMEPLLPPPVRGSEPYARESVPSLLTNLHYLFRDWGWPAAVGDENERTLASARRLLEPTPLGRTLVLGAGAGRLAYDLHRHAGASETAVIDIDPLLFAAAQAIVRGKTVPLTEGYADIDELTRVSRRWSLSAPGPQADERFHFLIADALNPPLAAESFDTVITPWFIDAIPADLRDAISISHRLLKPSGRWVNIGPLRYTPQVPISRRFTREEVFELAERAGFAIGAWEAGCWPSLVSGHSGRGKVEWIMSFCAVKRAGGSDGAAAPPPWLLFGHLPVPEFAGQHLFLTDDRLARLVTSAIDGRRTLDDLSALVVAELPRSNLSNRQVREAVRQCLSDVHPGCGSR